VAVAASATAAAIAGPHRGASSRAADSPGPTEPRSSTNRAPNRAPLGTPGAAGALGDGEETAASTPQAQVDPLVSNGLGSPSCKGALAAELPQAARRNCETSGFVAAAEPTGDFGLDVHIDTGALGTGSLLSSVTQDFLVTPAWMALVWAVHALVVMLEWSFTLDLLHGAVALGVGTGLRQMQATFTEPWLPLVLAALSITAMYQGLIRRRVADTLGEVLLVAAMMIGGVWIVVDPTGTVGALGRFADQASLGTLAAAAHGTPQAPGRAFAGSLGAVFATAIEVPWCYLEFGNVGWCREVSQLDPRLRAAALRIAAQEHAEIGCEPRVLLQAQCVPAGSPQARAIEHSVELLHDAQSNGAIFLALPANGPARNSINDEGSLLRVLCQSSEMATCQGPTAAQAEFRTGGDTWFRLGGLVLIAGGLLGMLLLFGFVTLQLLKAAIFSLLYLLLAPAMVLAPAFGDTGRALFRRWLLQLLGATISKLLFSFVLGVVLAVLGLLAQLTPLGWWTQWLLMSAFWWGAYMRRDQAFGAAAGALGGGRGAAAHERRLSIARRVGDALDTPRQGIATVRKARKMLTRPAPEVRPRDYARVGRERAEASRDEQALRTLERERGDAQRRSEAAPEIQHRLAGRRTQLERIKREGAIALAGGDTRRAAELAHRGQRVSGEIEREQSALTAAQGIVRDGERAQRRTGNVHTPERREAQDRFLDAQAALPSSSQMRRGGERRDYTALSGLAGYGREQYERLGPRDQRAARLEIDRELALRRELGETARALADAGTSTATPTSASTSSGQLRRRERRKASKTFDDALERRLQDAGQRLPASRQTRSSVMRDAHEVAARRKRQLGRDRS
jgi:hypothetical protein